MAVFGLWKRLFRLVRLLASPSQLRTYRTPAPRVWGSQVCSLVQGGMWLPAVRWDACLQIPVCRFCCLALLYLSPAFWSLSALFHLSCFPSPSSCLSSLLSSAGYVSTCLSHTWGWEDAARVHWDGWKCLPDREDKVFSPPLPSQACFLRWFSRCLIPDFIAQPSSALVWWDLFFSVHAKWVRWHAGARS